MTDLKANLERYKNKVFNVSDDETEMLVTEIFTDLSTTIGLIEKMRGVIEFYSDNNNYCTKVGCSVPAVHFDQGRTGRPILTELKSYGFGKEVALSGNDLDGLGQSIEESENVAS